MVEVTTAAAVAAGVAAAALVLVLVSVAAASARQHRAVSRRLAAVAARLELPGGADADERDPLTRLERLAQAAVLRVSEAEVGEARLAATLHEVSDGVVVCDEHGAVVWRNRAAAALTGEEQGGALVEEAVGEVLAAGVAGSELSRTVELLGPPRRTLTVSGRQLDDGRRTVGALAVVEDVSESRRLELVRRDFLSNVTAELKSPVGALGLLAGTIAAEDDPGLTRRLARRLEQESLRVGRIVDDLTELSRLDTEALPVRERVPVHLVVAQAVEEARSLALHRSITVNAAEAPARLTVEGDRRRLVSAVRHLVENAVKFSPEGSAVELKVRRHGPWVDVAVVDRGPGIPTRELDRIFECFYRVDRDGARDRGGTGLGLAIASQVAAAHGGEVRVASSEGEGSTFTLRLPAGSGGRAVPASEAG